MNENKNDDSSNKIIDNIIDQNDDLHTQEECINEKIILREQNNQENFISTYSDKESKSEVIQGTDFPLISKYGITVDPSGNNSYGSIGTDGNLKNNMGTITNNVGEKGYVKSVPIKYLYGNFCNHIIASYSPNDYAEITATIENSDIVNIIGYDVAEKYNEEYPYPCLQTIYDCKQSGSTTVEIEYYVNYNIKEEARLLFYMR